MNKPNILLLMVDQMTVKAMSVYGNSVCKMPHLDQLSSESVIFENAYTNAPICAPARFALLSGRESVRIGAFDNASEFPASEPTLAHHLRRRGYRTTLCGKMHFIGPDQLHGFNERITTDVYPSSFAWVPHWDKGASYITSGVTCASVLEAAPCVRSMQMDYDDEVEYRGVQKLYDLARARNNDPFFLTVSFTHPHHPFTISHEFWERYQNSGIDMPDVSDLPFEQLDYHSRGLYFAHGRHLHHVKDEHVRNARHAYYGMLSYFDDKIGRLMTVLNKTGLEKDTLVIFTSDHGEMLGERGMWHKHNFFEPSVRVPLLCRLPGEFSPGRNTSVVSHIDILPTLLDYIDGSKHRVEDIESDGDSFLSALCHDGVNEQRTAIADYLAIGSCVPCRMIRKGNYKYIYTHGHAEQLFDLISDPHELSNITESQSVQDVKSDLRKALLKNWDPEEVDTRVRQSQRQRIAINGTPGAKPVWDYVFRTGDDKRFVRNREVDGTKSKYRLPIIDSIPPNRPVLSTAQIENAMRTGSLA